MIPENVPEHERLARIVNAHTVGDGRQLDHDITYLARAIRERKVDDRYAAARIVMSAQMMDGSAHDAAVAKIADAVRGQAGSS